MAAQGQREGEGERGWRDGSGVGGGGGCHNGDGDASHGRTVNTQKEKQPANGSSSSTLDHSFRLRLILRPVLRLVLPLLLLLLLLFLASIETQSTSGRSFLRATNRKRERSKGGNDHRVKVIHFMLLSLSLSRSGSCESLMDESRILLLLQVNLCPLRSLRKPDLPVLSNLPLSLSLSLGPNYRLISHSYS